MSAIESFRTASLHFVNQNLDPSFIYSVKRQALNHLSNLINDKAPAVFSILKDGNETLQIPFYKSFTPAAVAMGGFAGYAGILTAATLLSPKKTFCKSVAGLTVSTVSSLAAIALAKTPEEITLAGSIALTTFAIYALSVCCQRTPKPASPAASTPKATAA
jgi:hypothetical protein